MKRQNREPDDGRLEAILEKLIASGESADASAIAGLLEARPSKDPGRWLLLGSQALLAGDLGTARKRLQRALECGGKDAELHYVLSSVCLLQGELEQAAAWAKKTIRAAPWLWPAHLNLARALEGLGDGAGAVVVLKGVVAQKAFPEDERREARLQLGLHIMRAGRFKEAAVHLRKAVLHAGAPVAAWRDLGHCLSRCGKLKEALAAFRTAAGMEPSADNLYELGNCLVSLGEHEEAAEILGRAARVDPRHVMANYDLGLARYMLGRHKEGADASRRVLADDPEMVLGRSNPGLGAMINLGLCLHEQGQYREALACFDKSIKASSPAYFNKGLTLFRMGRQKEAVTWFERCLDIDRNDKQALDLLGQSLDAAGRHEEAVASLRKALAIDPEYVLGHYDLGVILARRKDGQDEAMRCFKKTLALKPDDRTRGWALYGIACLQAVAGRKAQALGFLEKALKTGRIDRKHINADKDLDGLRREARFIKMMRGLSS